MTDRDPLLAPLEALLGTWDTEITHRLVDGVVTGRTAFAWGPGERYVLLRSEVDDARFPGAVQVLGRRESGEGLGLEHFDTRGVRRTYPAAVEGGVLRWGRDEPGFEQRGVLELRADEPVVGRWDRTKLEQVVTNLVSNALKYGAGAPVEVQVHSSGAMALLEVTDHGIGIAPQDLGRIFGKFERAAPVRQYSGFGLGLYIVRQLVEALGGGVDAQSAPGSGATFHIVLPLAGPETRLPPPPAQADLH